MSRTPPDADFEVRTVPTSPPIIEVSSREVNRRRPLRWIATVAVVPLVLALGGCASDEDRAERMYREAVELADRDGGLDEAIRRFETIAETYPNTTAAERARRDAVLYRGLEGAVQNFPVHRARDVMVAAARTVERWRARHRRVPPDLDTAYGSERPPADPWGRPLLYRSLRDGRSYELATLGADGEPGGDGPAADVRVRDGEFVDEP